MTLADMKVFNEHSYSTYTETLQQQINLFNGASEGTITLSQAAHRGDFSETAYFANIANLVRRRNAYGTGSLTETTLTQLLVASVKVAAGTNPVRMDPGQYKWTQLNQEVAGAALGQQLAVKALADMVNTAIGATCAALATVAAVVNDVSALTGGNQLANPSNMLATAMKFGDMYQRIRAWVMHSGVIATLWAGNLTNATQLFTYGTVNIQRDAFGRMFIISDVPALAVAGSPAKYRTLGLTQGAVAVEENSDFTENWETKNGGENIIRTYQAEWSFQLGIKGFTWDRTNGGASPTDAALFTGTNWDKVASDNKDLAGVMLISAQS